MKKFVSLLLVVVMVSALLATAALADKDAEIEALNVNKNDLQTAINQWMERDKQVVIDLDASQREATSTASEKILFSAATSITISILCPLVSYSLSFAIRSSSIYRESTSL